MKRIAFFAATVALAASAAAQGARIDYNRDVRPILSDRCFACHGPDEAQRKAGLRLDSAEGAHALSKSGSRAVVPGDSAASELVRRVLSADPEETMPPPEAKRQLSTEERELLARWVAQGGDYQPHWAFVAPRQPAAPSVKDASWARDPLDAHVLSNLEARGLAPTAPADPLVLLRRAHAVLAGIPPTPEEADAFRADPSDAAYERAVDALLASPRAAEHTASVWLDLARYADTHGFQTDNPNFVWPWRDWLLKALRDNKPYDQFVVDLVAGDLKPQATLDDRVATAFNRLHRMTEEGGSISEEFRQEGIADRVGVFGTAFLGLTVECARCHDHKYDPVPMREYYALAAMFGSIDENGLKPYSLPGDAPPPYVRLSTPEQDARTRELQQKEAEAKAFWSATRAKVLAAQGGATSDVPAPAPAASYAFEALVDGTTPNAAGEGKPASIDRRRPEQLGSVALGEGRKGLAMRFDGDGGIWLDGLSGFGRHDDATFAMWIKPGARNLRGAIVQAAGFYTQDADAAGIELELDLGRVRWSAINCWPGSAASVRTVDELPVDRWTHLVAVYDGSSSAEGLRLYLDGAPAKIEVVRDGLDGPLAGNTLEVGSRSRGVGFRDGALDELRVWRRALTAAEARTIAREDGAAPAAAPEGIGAAHAADTDRDVVAAREAWRASQRELAAHLDPIPRLACMADSPWAPPTHVLKRGAYDQPDLARRIEPGAIEAVLPFDPALPRNRMGLARWLVDPRNPLVARVQVNRLWTQVFGRGLVETAENFGVQGASPSNQDLLDSLAWDYAHGDGTPGSAWNSRRMLKRLVTSATFRQASACDARTREADPLNNWCSRGPSTRMTAEMLRDQAIAASGQLNEAFGGPSAKPWQPEGLWHEAGQIGNYVPDMGPPARRRSLYSFRKRTVPVPDLAAFDAGTREACVARRGTTNTPLQTLVLWNDRVYLDAARATARRVAAETPEVEARVRRMYRLVCTREPGAEELAALRDLVEGLARRYATSPQDAAKVCGSQDAQLAALTLACTTIYASDGALMVR